MLFVEVPAHPAPFSQVTPLRVSHAPALLLAASFALGIACRSWWQPPVGVVLTCLVLLGVSMWARIKAPRIAWSVTMVAWVVLGWAAVSLQPSHQDTSLAPYADSLQRQLEGTVMTARVIADSPQEGTLEGAPREVVQVRASHVEDITPDVSTMRPVTAGVLVSLIRRDASRTVDYLPCGTHIPLTVRMHPESRYLDPDVWNYADQLQSQGVSVAATADIKNLQILPSSSLPLTCIFQRAQHWSSERVEKLTSSPWMTRLPAFIRWSEADAAMLRAMLFGDRTSLQQNVRIAFERTGSFHLFVVAGVHIAILIAVLFQFFQQWRMPPWPAAIVTITLTATYAVFTGFGEPVQRALFMSSIYLLVLVVARDKQVMNALGIAILVMLVVDPSALFQSSLQMTVLSVFAVGGIAVPLVQRTVGPCVHALKRIEDVTVDVDFQPYLAELRVTCRVVGRLATGWLRWGDGVPVLQRVPAWALRVCLVVVEAVLSTLVAEMVMALPMAVYFHRLTPFAAPANLLALPLVGLVMGCAMATFLLSLVHPLLALVPAAVTALALHGISVVIRTLGAFHGADVRVPAPLPLMVVTACVAWLIAVVLLREHWPRQAWMGCGLAVLAFVLVVWPPKPALARDALAFTAVDVGQGDSEVVTAPDGKVMVIDAGGPVGSEEQARASTFDVGESVVSPMLWRDHIRRIDVLAITHAHSDHIGGAMAVLRNFHPREIWISVDTNTPMLQELLEEAGREGITIRRLHAGDVATLGSVRVVVESPASDYRPGTEVSNDDSLVLRLQYGKAAVLTEGDAEHASEEAMVRAGLVPVTLLKVGHHGSNTSTSEAFLEQVRPQCAVISCGRGNPFGHPRMPVLERLQAMGVKTSRTDTMGAVRYLLYADGSVTTSILMSKP
ncbi:MAG TPA: ComEC/Rec2 family competence protein [Terriglobus sp.]